MRRLGLPAVRAATRQAMRLLGSHFVLGQTIDEALHRARGHAEFRYSFDMLGEGARTAADAEQIFRRLCGRDRRDRRAAPATRRCRNAPGNFRQTLGAASALRGDLARARAARACAAASSSSRSWRETHDLQFTVDAEEADRLELSLEIIAAVLGDPSLRGWDGFGLAVQAYQKRALARDRLDRGDRRAHRGAG